MSFAKRDVTYHACSEGLPTRVDHCRAQVPRPHQARCDERVSSHRRSLLLSDHQPEAVQDRRDGCGHNQPARCLCAPLGARDELARYCKYVTALTDCRLTVPADKGRISQEREEHDGQQGHRRTLRPRGVLEPLASESYDGCRKLGPGCH